MSDVVCIFSRAYIQRISAVFLLFFFFLFPKAYGQIEQVWAFGNRVGLDFGSGTPVAQINSMSSFEGCASICDANGKLLFYTNGSKVWDKNNVLMPHGSDLTGQGYITHSTSQGALIVPQLENPHQYYIFSLEQYGRPIKGRLFYSVVDVTLNDGAGDVLKERKGILMDSLLTEKMTGIVGNNCNLWVLVHDIGMPGSTGFHAWEITASGINATPVTSHVGNFLESDVLLHPIRTPNYVYGTLKASPDRRRLICCDTRRGLELFAFDPNSGKVSDPVILDSTSAASYYSATFSPDNSKLYAIDKAAQQLIQFDLNTTNAEYGKTIISSLQVNSSADLKVGPDGKVYFGEADDRKLSCILAPNLPGKACQYTPDVIKLSARASAAIGLPNDVPVFKPDTVISKTILTAKGCFGNMQVMDLEVSGNPGWAFQWHDGLPVGDRKVHRPGIYWVRYRTPCSFRVDTFEILLPGVMPEIHTTGSCPHPATGKAWVHIYPTDTTIYQFQWRDSTHNLMSTTDTLPNVPAGSYTLQITTLQCDTTLPLSINEENYNLSFEADSGVCVGEHFQINNTSHPYFTNFNWEFGDGAQSHLVHPVHRYDLPGIYPIMLSGAGVLCSDTIYQDVVVDPRVLGTFDHSSDSICVGERISFHPEPRHYTMLGRRWSLGDGTEFISMDDEPFVHAYDQPGIMAVVLHSRFRVCPDTSFSRNLYVAGVPQFSLQEDRLLCLDGSPITLSCHFSQNASGDYDFLWSTGDTTEAISVVRPGLYSLTLSQRLPGCQATASVTIARDCYVDIPNAFTPNGDGTHDTFFPRSLLSSGVSSLHFQVFNRWGQRLFETSHVDGRGWDGRFNDKEQPAGVYVYRLTVAFHSGMEETYQGNVTLVR